MLLGNEFSRAGQSLWDAARGGGLSLTDKAAFVTTAEELRSGSRRALR